MNYKRALAAVLWVYSCWVAGGVAEFLIGTPAFLGLAVGIAAALFFGLDPFGVVWAGTQDKAVRPSRASSIDGGKVLGDASTL